MPQSNYSCQQKDKSSSPHNEQLTVMYHNSTSSSVSCTYSPFKIKIILQQLLYNKPSKIRFRQPKYFRIKTHIYVPLGYIWNFYYHNHDIPRKCCKKRFLTFTSRTHSTASKVTGASCLIPDTLMTTNNEMICNLLLSALFRRASQSTFNRL